MTVDFTFRNVDSSDLLMAYMTDRLEKLDRFEVKPMEVHVVVSGQRHECQVEVTILEGRRKYKAIATTNDYYRSCEMCVNKLQRQLSKEKRRIRHHKNPEKSSYGKLQRLTPQLESDFTKPFRKEAA